MGGVEGALVSHADRVYNQLSADLQVLCRTLFMHLVTQERTRAIRSMKELAGLAGDEQALDRLVEQLVESRLWVVTADEGDATVEVVHESLITSWPSLRRWLDESHEDSVFIDQLMTAANQWSAKNRDVGLLWRGEMAAELEHFQRRFRDKLPDLARDFVAAVSQQERRSATRKRRLQIGGVALLGSLLAIASVGLYVVNQERRKADENARIADENAHIAERRLAEQLRAEQERTQAERGRKQAESRRRVAEEKSDVLEDKVKLNAEEIAEKNLELQAALQEARSQERTAVLAQEAAEARAREAEAAKKKAEQSAKELQVLLDRERARSERLNAQIGTLVEEL
jgi:hypothetical protein